MTTGIQQISATTRRFRLPALLAAVCAVTLSGCATQSAVDNYRPDVDISQLQRWSYLTGTWYGCQTLKDGRQLKSNRFPDGRYLYESQVIAADRIQPMDAEAGQWGTVGPIYFSIFHGWIDGDTFQQADSSDPYNYHAYEILKLTSGVFEYRSYASGSVYQAMKVSADFEFPELGADGCTSFDEEIKTLKLTD